MGPAQATAAQVVNKAVVLELQNNQSHGLRTPNEGINQRYLKNWADVADKICLGRT